MSDEIELRRVGKSPEITVLRSNTGSSSDDNGRATDPEQDVFALAPETKVTEQMQVSSQVFEGQREAR